MKYIILTLALLFTTGCAHTYSESTTSAKITEDTFRISAMGNEYNNYEEIHDFLLLKAAETTKELGHTHFYFIGTQDTTKTSAYSIPGSVNTTNYGGYTSTTFTPGFAGTSSEPGTTGMVKVFSLTEGKDAPHSAFSADEVIKNIGQRVKAEE